MSVLSNLCFLGSEGIFTIIKTDVPKWIKWFRILERFHKLRVFGSTFDEGLALLKTFYLAPSNFWKYRKELGCKLQIDNQRLLDSQYHNFCQCYATSRQPLLQNPIIYNTSSKGNHTKYTYDLSQGETVHQSRIENNESRWNRTSRPHKWPNQARLPSFKNYLLYIRWVQNLYETWEVRGTTMISSV